MEMASFSTLDILSDLPENILESIFSHLSMRDVVRTSVLSTKWRYKCISVPHLIFDDDCIPVSVGSLRHDKLVQIVNRVLLLHRGPVLTFQISSSQLKTCPDIDSWILYLTLYSVNSIKDFKLLISEPEYHNVHPCLFSFKKLTQLILAGCIIVLPVMFKGFSCLTTLAFKHVTLSNAAFECLVSTCPQLERLALIDIDGPTRIELSNPKLKYLWIYGKFIPIYLKELRFLVFGSFFATTVAHPDQRRTYSFSNILGSLPSVQNLAMGGLYLQSLAIGDMPRRLPSTYDHLKSIYFALNVEDMKDILVAIWLLKSSPNLQKLEIHLWCSKRDAIVPIMDQQKAKEQLECTFNKLRVVNIFRLLGMKMELEFIKFILANSPVLETMNIILAMNGIDKGLLLKELLRLKRASPQAEICVLEP
ncbi:F-box/FBD/LRR-repeat protein At1g13570-like [Macadamia integrifolia]|uniref:F-box/FBD/LRR-repeat protein At1g13570-like n=1 Tax=Macadamia integrifolia TaxID=60698 RepID=UPI001C4F6DB8|nr:F-box/FBD/LRR-repeat protein At1g13570-like [Macadamia integrifolia]XP_042504105.1 F-box/FBD/LRR-repeat protein At1g13570-like [Macadamia integrifolia]XP_042504107.1 F-box/FBD/LRR-repeat protein At1g13570-like [Macadamia integrifolia]XP_042504108.1 F-box/FBD/LRR-repeat protein At1g13570-like [Macadamia integrifolia]XP_042504109.1 F-box/FBD/LRR-repeat protein At1g13570-like [Macadamia integrifolia]XP_042504110.1 F-box/FBD/LRR-repeat protein At1g13570-like [Macadamia integrifolia]XP_04250411